MKTTIVIPISRDTFLPELFDSLKKLICDRQETSLFVYVDGSMDLLEKVKRQLLSADFAQKEYHFRNKGIGSDGSVRRRRQRIADIHNEIRQKLQPCDYVFLLEDDTIVPDYTLDILLGDYNKLPTPGIFSGIELGRWGFPIIGAWEKTGDVITSSPMVDGIREVSATGLYCLLTKYEYYRDHEFAPFEKILGCDVQFGFALEAKGLKNYTTAAIKCVHVTKSGHLGFDHITPIQLRYTRDESIPFGWRQEVL